MRKTPSRSSRRWSSSGRLCKLELLKEEVEKEVAAAMSKREDVDRRYNETVAQIQEMEALHNVENDVALAGIRDEEGLETDEEDDEILEPSGNDGLFMDELANGAVTVEADEATEALDSFAAQAEVEAAAGDVAADHPEHGGGGARPRRNDHRCGHEHGCAHQHDRRGTYHHHRPAARRRRQ